MSSMLEGVSVRIYFPAFRCPIRLFGTDVEFGLNLFTYVERHGRMYARIGHCFLVLGMLNSFQVFCSNRTLNHPSAQTIEILDYGCRSSL